MPIDLEERLEQMSPLAPRPSDEAKERARQAALDALPGSEPVRVRQRERPTQPRRRAGSARRWAIVVAPVVLALGVLVATPAFGIRGGLLDFLWGENARKPEPTVETAICRAQNFRVAFDALKGAVVATKEGRLAFASYRTRAITGSCSPVAQTKINSYSDALLSPAALYGSANLMCATQTDFKIDVHPVRGGVPSEIVGTNLIVSVASAGRTEILVSAVLKNREEGLVASRLYYAPKYCQRG